jgi:hypothetical protein
LAQALGFDFLIEFTPNAGAGGGGEERGEAGDSDPGGKLVKIYGEVGHGFANRSRPYFLK